MTEPQPVPEREISTQVLRAQIAILRELNLSPEPWSRLQNVVMLAAQALGAETGSLYLVRGRPRRLRARVLWGKGMERSAAPVLELGEGVPGWVAQHGEMVVLVDPERDPRFQPVAADGAPAPSIRNLICVPLRDEIGVAGVIELVNHPVGFGTVESTALVAIADELAVSLRKARLLSELQRQRLLQNLLFDINRSLVSSLKLNEVLWRIVDAVGRVVEFDAIGIFLLQEGGVIEEIVQRSYAPDQLDRLHQKLGEGVVGWVISTGEPACVPDVTRDRRYIRARPETRSELVAPMISQGRVIGAFNVESDRLDAYGEEHLERLTAFADQATVAVEIARLHETALRAQRLEEELSIAREIQLDLMPDHPPILPGIDLAGLNVPSEKVGGDYFDFIEVAPGQLGLVIGDVSGKGVAAALIMASFRAALLAEIRNNYSISTILGKVNLLLCESTEPDRFVTALYGVLDLASGRFTYACAGHNPAILVRADGTIEELGEGGTILGVLPESTYEETFRDLDTGDMLVLYTDGVTEAADARGAEFGTDRLFDLALTLRAQPAAAGAAAVERAVRRFAGSGAVLDDLTLIVMRLTDGEDARADAG